jgi:hypothetical protein
VRFPLLLPFLGNGITPILKGTKESIFAFLGFELLIIIYPNISDKENVMRYAILANMYTTILYVFVVVTCTAFFGVELLKRLVIPIFSLFRSYKAPVLERLDLFFIILWFPAMAASFRKYIYSCYIGITALFPIRHLKIYITVFFSILILASRIPTDLYAVFSMMEYFNNGAVLLMIFLILSLIFSFISKKGV